MNRTVLAATGILAGLILAALLVFSGTPSKKVQLDTEISTKTISAPPPQKTKHLSPTPAPQRAKARIDAPQRATAPPRPIENPTPDIPQEEPVGSFDGADIHVVVQTHARWGPVIGILNRSNDPMAMDIKRRIHEMRMEMMAMRRNPEGVDVEELTHRQRILLTELRQIPSWGPELADSAAKIENVLDGVGEY